MFTLGDYVLEMKWQACNELIQINIMKAQVNSYILKKIVKLRECQSFLTEKRYKSYACFTKAK